MCVTGIQNLCNTLEFECDQAKNLLEQTGRDGDPVDVYYKVVT